MAKRRDRDLVDYAKKVIAFFRGGRPSATDSRKAD
jgi:hypothetical protein